MDLYDLSEAQNIANFRYYDSNVSKSLNVSNVIRPAPFFTPQFNHPRINNNYHIREVTSHGEFIQPAQKGIIFEWPQPKKLYSEKELCFVGWLIAQTLFWLHIIHIFPCGSALALDQPPLKYTPPLREPENRDYIIEPDWDSCYI